MKAGSPLWETCHLNYVHPEDKVVLHLDDHNKVEDVDEAKVGVVVVLNHHTISSQV